MDAAAQIKKVLGDVLTDIQVKQGLKCPLLTDNIRPLKDLERFDSPMSIGATGKIARKLGIDIPPGKNIFGDSSGVFTIAKTVALLMSFAKTATTQKAGA
jgi:hypothetical protein